MGYAAMPLFGSFPFLPWVSFTHRQKTTPPLCRWEPLRRARNEEGWGEWSKASLIFFREVGGLSWVGFPGEGFGLDLGVGGESNFHLENFGEDEAILRSRFFQMGLVQPPTGCVYISERLQSLI